MRVGIVCPYSVSWFGGVQTHVLGLADALAGRGHAVRVLAPCDGAPPSPMVDPVGRSVGLPANGSVARLAMAPSAWAAASRWPRRRRLDVVHVHEPLAPLTSLAVTTTSSAPMVGTFHAAAERWWPYERGGRLLRRAVDRLSVVTAVSDPAEALASRHFPGHYERTPNGIDFDRLARAEPDPSAPPVVFVGRLEPRKGPAVMVEAARHIQAEVALVGDGPLRRELEAKAPGNVRFLGARSSAERDRLRRGASVVCVPSLGGESFGFVVLEAMAAGAVVVASDLPGYRSVLGGAGRLVPPGDARALATAVNEMLSDPGDLADRAQAAAAAYSWERLVLGVEELYRSVQ